MLREIDINRLMGLNIPNLRAISENGIVIGVRGKSLSNVRNRKNHQHLQVIKEAGICSVIDLRAADHSIGFVDVCEALGLRYYHFPIDREYTADAEIIKALPLLFDVILRGGFYIACAQGMHRTDIALALCYLFNPKAQELPVLYGHHRNGKLVMEDIFMRANSIYRALTPEAKALLGWDEAFDLDFVKRKKLLTERQKDWMLNEPCPVLPR